MNSCEERLTKRHEMIPVQETNGKEVQRVVSMAEAYVRPFRAVGWRKHTHLVARLHRLTWYIGKKQSLMRSGHNLEDDISKFPDFACRLPRPHRKWSEFRTDQLSVSLNTLYSWTTTKVQQNPHPRSMALAASTSTASCHPQ